METSTVVETVTLTPAKFDELKNWQQITRDKFTASSVYSELHPYYQGFADALDDTLALLRQPDTSEVVEAVKESTRSLKAPVIVIGVVVVSVIVYKRRKNGDKHGS